MNEEKQDEAATLNEILSSVNELIAETRSSRQELREAETELKEMYGQKKVSSLTYDVQSERIRRDYQEIDHTLRQLDRQRKVFLEKLQNLE